MDPPAHIFANRKTLDQFSQEQFNGKALVVDCRDLKEGQAITIDKINIDKAKLANVIKLRDDEPSRYYCLDGIFI